MSNPWEDYQTNTVSQASSTETMPWEDFQQPMPTSTPQPAPQEKPSLPMEFVKGVARGGYGMLGLPVDIGNLINSAVGYGQEKPVGGSQWLMEKQKELGGADLSRTKDAGLVSNIVSSAGEFAPSLLTGGAGMLAKGKTAAEIVPSLVRSGIGGSIGAGAARTIAPDSPMSEIIGGVAGAGIAGSIPAIRNSMFNSGKYFFAKGLKTTSKQAKTVEEAEAIADTIIKQGGVNINKKGADKLSNSLKTSGSLIDNTINNEAIKGTTIPIDKVSRYVDETIEYASRTGDPLGHTESVKGIISDWKGFMKKKYPDGNIPIEEVQKMKTTLYNRNPNAWGGVPKAMQTDFDKQLARGARKSLEEIVPSIKDANATHAKLNDAVDAMQHARKAQLGTDYTFFGNLGRLPYHPAVLSRTGRLLSKLGKERPTSIDPNLAGFNEAFREGLPKSDALGIRDTSSVKGYVDPRIPYEGGTPAQIGWSGRGEPVGSPIDFTMKGSPSSKVDVTPSLMTNRLGQKLLPEKPFKDLPPELQRVIRARFMAERLRTGNVFPGQVEKFLEGKGSLRGWNEFTGTK